MKSTNLIRLLSTFSRKEMTRFKSYVFSEYVNKHQGTRQFLTLLETNFPNFPLERISESALRAQLGNGLPISRNELSLRSTYLLRLALDFLAHERRGQQKQFTQVAQLTALRQREQFKLYDKLERKIMTKPALEAVMNTDFYYGQYKLLSEADSCRNQRGKYDEPELILKKQEMLNAFFLTEKIKDACELLQRGRVLKKENFSRLEDFALDEIQNNIHQYKNIPPLMVYHAIYEMLLKDTGEAFKWAEDKLMTYHLQLGKFDLVNIYNFLLNFCIQRVNEGKREWLSRSFDLYKRMLENNLLQVDGLLPEWHYKNLATNGLLLNETDWVYNFIHQYKSSLTPEIAENAYAYNLAALYYQVGEYDKVLPLLLKVEYTEWRYALNAKVLLLKTYYEMEESEALFALHDSFRQFIQRHKQLNDFRRRSYYNLLRYTIKAHRVKIDKSYSTLAKQKLDYQKLKQKFDGCSQCFNRSWVSEKIAGLKVEVS